MPLPVPPDLEAALAEHPAARDVFWSLPADRKDAWITWLNAARVPGARNRRIAYMLQRLAPAGAAVATSEEVAEPVYAVPPEREWWPWLLGLLLLLAVAAVLIWFFAVRNNNNPTNTVVTKRVAVPAVVGLRQDAALKKLQANQLAAVVRRTQSDKPAGFVTDQAPGAGTQVAAGTNVTLTVSAGPPGVAVPTVTGLSAADAIRKLQAAKLSAKIVQVQSKLTPGTVLTQKPDAGTRAPTGSVVTLTVSKGGAQVAVPNVVGQQENAAISALQSAGLQPAVVRVPSPKPANTVVAQDPAAGQKVDQGANVRLNVSEGPAQTTTAATTTATTTAATPPPASGTVVVPSLVNQQLSGALGALERVGLRATVKYLPGQKPVGTVVGQNPAAGAKVPRGTRVQVNVSEGPSPGNPTQVPDVTGEDAATAQTDLQDAGFQIVMIDRTTGPGTKGTVVEQQPASGRALPTGDIIAIYVRR